MAVSLPTTFCNDNQEQPAALHAGRWNTTLETYNHFKSLLTNTPGIAADAVVFFTVFPVRRLHTAFFWRKIKDRKIIRDSGGDSTPKTRFTLPHLAVVWLACRSVDLLVVQFDLLVVDFDLLGVRLTCLSSTDVMWTSFKGWIYLNDDTDSLWRH